MSKTHSLLTPSQAVERLRTAGVEVVEETVRDWARRGLVRHTRTPSGRYLFAPEDIDAIATPQAAS